MVDIDDITEKVIYYTHLDKNDFYVDAVSGKVNVLRYGMNISKTLIQGKIPFKLNNIEGDFYCISQKLTTLFNGPNIVTGNYGVYNL